MAFSTTFIFYTSKDCETDMNRYPYLRVCMLLCAECLNVVEYYHFISHFLSKYKWTLCLTFWLLRKVTDIIHDILHDISLFNCCFVEVITSLQLVTVKYSFLLVPKLLSISVSSNLFCCVLLTQVDGVCPTDESLKHCMGQNNIHGK